MLITLHCGGMPFDGTTIESKSLGGSESAAYYMARELAQAGHRVTLFTNTAEESITNDVRYVPAGNVSEQYPMGDLFHYYSMNTPVDVMIIQRHPKAFAYEWQSKINLWWIHDLALYRSKGIVQEQMWNVDGVLTVSEWHKKQVCEVYGFNPEIVYPITNGVDLSLYSDKFKFNIDERRNSSIEPNETALLFSSRPERGLENLVRTDGIMEKLYSINPDFHLYVCAYDNVTGAMRDFYEYLYKRCDELKNVTNLGALTKQELADVQRQCDLHVYPSDFEETSCITAMETMAAGLPMIACNVGALEETTDGSGRILIDLKDGKVDEELFINEIQRLTSMQDALDAAKENQLEKAEFYSWSKSCKRLLSVVDTCFSKSRISRSSVINELLQKSDYYAIHNTNLLYEDIQSGIETELRKELNECYSFTDEESWDEHYANYYEYEKERGVDYGKEDLTNNHRFEHVASMVSSLTDNSVILDYGCAHGHYTINLAKRNPDKTFIGIDITQSNIDKAREWAKDDGIENVTFMLGRVENGRISTNGGEALALIEADCIIAAEVLEHVNDYAGHADTLQQYLKDDGLMIVTTPYGPWEAIGYKEHWPWRAHVHHFEREDLADIWGHNKDFNVVNVPSGYGLGSYITSWINNKTDSLTIDYERKLKQVAPRQTVSCCMIVKDASASIQRCLASVLPYVDELVISFDPTCDTMTRDIAIQYTEHMWPEKSFIWYTGESPLEVGFDTARNSTIEKASGDWILWIDADEYLHEGNQLHKYLRNNQYNGYAVYQHHFSMNPVGILKTDMPVRLFRQHKGIEFKGLVHEHPEQELNKGVGHVTCMQGISILHDGYIDEKTRQGRFHRNINLLTADRKKNPERILGKFLWLRDLAQMSKWDMQQNGGHITSEIVNRIEEGIKIWKELVKHGDPRIAVDSLEFYSDLCRINGGGFEMDVRLDTNNYNYANADEIKPVKGYFDSQESAKLIIDLMFNERTKLYWSKYS